MWKIFEYFFLVALSKNIFLFKKNERSLVSPSRIPAFFQACVCQHNPTCMCEPSSDQSASDKLTLKSSNLCWQGGNVACERIVLNCILYKDRTEKWLGVMVVQKQCWKNKTQTLHTHRWGSVSDNWLPTAQCWVKSTALTKIAVLFFFCFWLGSRDCEL